MKIKELESNLVADQPGSVKITAEEPDDFWLLYNIIAPGDVAGAETTRKMHQSADHDGNPKDPKRVKFKMELKITDVEYDKDSCMIWLRGRTATANTYLGEGVFHKIEIERNKAFYLTKRSWDGDAIESLRDGCKRPVGADLAVLMIKEGIAEVYLVGKSLCDLRERVAGNKGKGEKVTESEEAKVRFMESVFRAFRKHVDFGIIRCLMIAGPGTMKDEFRQYMLSEAKRLKLKSVLESKSRIVVVDAESVSKRGLFEVLRDPGIVNVVKDVKCGMEVRAMRDLNDMISNKSDRACYGPKSVDIACELAAIETLLITDELYRNGDVGIRRRYGELVDSVKRSGGKALVFSSMNVFGEQLAQLTGVAAILRFPVPDIEDLEL